MASKSKTPPKTKTPANTGRKPDDSSDSDDDEDDEDEDEDDLDGRVNAIITNRLKRFAKDTDKKLGDIMTAITALKPTKSDEDGEDSEESESNDGEETPAPKGKKASKSGMSPAEAKKLARMEKELAEEKAARKAAENAQKEAAEKAQRDEERNVFAQALAAAGISDKALSKGALATLVEEGKIIRDDDGKVKFKGVDKYGIEAFLEPSAGISQWLKGDGKAYVPAVSAGGSGSDGQRNNGGGSNMNRSEYSKLSPQEQAAIELERAFMGLPKLT